MKGVVTNSICVIVAEMKRILLFGLFFIIGLVAGLGLSRAFQNPVHSADSMAPAEQADSEITTSPNTELARLRVQVANQASRIGVLESDLLAARQAQMGAVAETGWEDSGRRNLEQRGRGRMDRWTQSRVDGMVEHYGLTPLQEEALTELFRRRAEHFRAQRSGETESPFDMDLEMQAVLSPEQFNAYLDDSQQEIYNRAELMATSQVVRLSQLVQLAPEMVDSVYETIHLTAQEMMIARQAGQDYAMREVLDNRLSNFLTPEQMAVYREGMRGPGRTFFGP